MTATNPLRTLWADGATAYGAFVFTRLDPVIVEALGKMGYDYVCIDLQHGLMAFDDALAMMQALAIGRTVPIVRVPANDAAMIGRVLDAGALGVIVPMVNSAEEAARAVAACRYAPAGIRSFGPVRSGIAYGPPYAADANGLVLCIPMIETAQAVEQAADIVAVPGVDAVYVGPTDLSLTYGLAPLLDNDGAFAEALQTVVTAADAKGVIAGIQSNTALAGKRVAEGFRMVTITHDLGILAAGFAAELATTRQAAGSTRPPGAY